MTESGDRKHPDRYYPALLNVEGRPCLVVGGGGVGARKVATLVECGAQVTVVSREVAPSLEDLEQAGKVTIRRRAYESADQNGMFLVVGATDDEDLNRQVAADAEAAGRLVNIADRPASCNFILPAVLRRGDLVITVSTSGKSPAHARRVKEQLAALFGDEHGLFLDLMGAIRERLLAAEHAPEQHKPLFEELIDKGLLDCVAEGDAAAMNHVLEQVLGPGFCVEELVPDMGQQKDSP